MINAKNSSIQKIFSQKIFRYVIFSTDLCLKSLNFKIIIFILVKILPSDWSKSKSKGTGAWPVPIEYGSFTTTVLTGIISVTWKIIFTRTQVVWVRGGVFGDRGKGRLGLVKRQRLNDTEEHFEIYGRDYYLTALGK